MKRIDALALPVKLLSHTTTLFQKGSSKLSTTLVFVIKELEKEIGLQTEGGILTTSDVEVLLQGVLEKLGFVLTAIEKNEIIAHIEKEQRPFGLLQELVDDPSISDIIITDYTRISVQQGRKNFKTDIIYPSRESYEVFVERLLTRAGTTYSTKKPIADGMIGSFARIHAIHSSICESGPYVTIRLNRFSSVTLQDLNNVGLAPLIVLEYLKTLVQTGHTILIGGEVGTGKTTLARAIASSIPQEESIVVIEDTPEIRLDHPHVRYLETREANNDGAGRITPSECIRAGMRMAMNRIIFGEIRDAEAAESFIDVCASGHPGLSTIHARSAFEAVVRLELFLGRAQKGVEKIVLTEQIATAVQTIVHVDICKKTGKRRIQEVKEIGPVADGVLRQRDIFRYQTHNDIPSWKVIQKVSAYKEKLEQAPGAFFFSEIPSILDLDDSILYRESVLRKSA